MATKLWAVRLAEYGIQVYEVQPGLIKTDMTSGVRGKYDELIDQGMLLQARWGLPEDVGAFCVFLASEASSWITGKIYELDGGLRSSFQQD